MTTLFAAAGFLPGSIVGRPTRELALHEAVIGAAPRLLSSATSRRVAIHEFTLRGARPDAAILDVDWLVLEQRLAMKLPPLTATADLAVRAALLSGKATRQESVVDHASRYTSVASAARALRKFERLGYLVAERRGVRLAPGATRLVRRSVGVEAKVGNWRLAAAQARRWRLTFDECYLAFPAGYARGLESDLPTLNQFGLLGVEPEGGVHLLRRPPSRRSDSFNSVLVDEAFYTRYLREAEFNRSDARSTALNLRSAFAA
jgi:hypothetical protein